jgi:hypothetical protein
LDLESDLEAALRLRSLHHVATGLKGLVDLVGHLCEPDPYVRGYPCRGQSGAGQYSLHRVVAKLDLLARRASIRARGTEI